MNRTYTGWRAALILTAIAGVFALIVGAAFSLLLAWLG
jgi:anti-sigma-K factor RskA